MTGTIDITCSLPAPTLAQVRAWLTRTGWEVDTFPRGQSPYNECWEHSKHGHTWVPREELNDWLTYISSWIADRAWQIDATPEAVYREIMGQPRVWLVTGFSSDGAQSFAVVCLSEETADRIACDHVSGPESANAYSIEECEVRT